MKFHSVLAGFLSLGTSGLTTLAVSSPQIAPPSCSAQLANPYQSTPKALASCGLKTVPLQGAIRLVDGGTEYRYVANGHTVMYRVPPAGFNALSADTSQLARYGMPERPTEPSGLLRWQQKMQHAHAVDPPRFLVQPNLSAAACNATCRNWSGYVAKAGPFTRADTEWIEPALGSSRCSVNAVVFWSGLGGWNGDVTLGQGGTFEGQNISIAGLSQHQAWTEVIPYGMDAWNLWATQGQQFESITNRANGLYEHWLQNIYTGQYVDVFETGNYTGATADFIAERPETSPGVFTNLSAFGTVSFQLALANTVAISTKTPQSVTMQNSSGWNLAVPSALSAPYSSFSITQRSCN